MHIVPCTDSPHSLSTIPYHTVCCAFWGNRKIRVTHALQSTLSVPALGAFSLCKVVSCYCWLAHCELQMTSLYCSALLNKITTSIFIRAFMHVCICMLYACMHASLCMPCACARACVCACVCACMCAFGVHVVYVFPSTSQPSLCRERWMPTMLPVSALLR